MGVVWFLNRLRPKDLGLELIRIGSPNDGGYLIPQAIHQEYNGGLLLSPGVAANWDFEMELSQKFGVDIAMCDASISEVQEFSGLRSFRPLWLKQRTTSDSISLEDWIVETRSDRGEKLFLQMDIEGFEYEVISTTSREVLKKFEYIVVEIHNVDMCLNLYEFVAKFLPFIRKLTKDFTPIHAHTNNCCATVTRFGREIPVVLELTLVNNRWVDKNTSIYENLPHPFDANNFPEMPSIDTSRIWNP